MFNSKLLSIQNIYFSYQDDWILHDWTASLNMGEICHLQGRNGCGKSTLLRIISGILRPTAGTVSVHPSGKFKSSIAYVGHRLGLHPFLTIRENLMLGFDSNVDIKLRTYLGTLPLDHCIDQPVHTLSQGQAHKVSIIQMLLHDAQLWILDEPFSNLDAAGEEWLWQQMKVHQTVGGTVLLTAHQKLDSDVKVWQL